MEPSVSGSCRNIISRHWTGQSVIEDTLIMLLVPMRVGCHQPCSQSQCVISDEEVWHVTVICRERVWFWEIQVIVLLCSLES